MKKLFTFFLLVCTSFLSAQNYKTIDPNRELYYADTSTNVFAIKADSINIVGADTSYFSFKTLREDPSSTDTWDSCHYFLDDSWMGRKVIIKPNGYNVFINEDNDSIFINTQANLGDTFLVYTYPNSSFIKATVTNIDTSTILGMIDSVKTYTLFSNYTGFNLNPAKIKIAKANGLITMFSFFKFPNGNKSTYYGGFNTNFILNDYDYSSPTSYVANYELVGKSNPKAGITKLTVGEVYDFDIGDEFNYLYYNPLEIHYTEIMNKFLDPSGDSVVYSIREKILNITNLTLISDITSNFKYYNLNDYILAPLPEEIGSSPFQPFSAFVRLNLKECNGFSFLTESSGPFNVDASVWGNFSCFQTSFEAWGGSAVYQPGLGLVNFSSLGCPNCYSNDYELQAHSKTNSSCGTIVTGINDIQNKNISFAIYPNPATNSFNYSIDSFEKIDMEIMDVSGKMVLAHHQIKAVGTIDISTLKAGIYFVKGISDKGATILKLIVN